jgi:hypothetical protein
MDDSRGAGWPEAVGGQKTTCRVKRLRCGAANGLQAVWTTRLNCGMIFNQNEYFDGEQSMSGKINSISAKDISSAVKAAVKNSATLKGITATDPSLATIRPPIIGFVVRDLEVKDASMGELNKLAAHVAESLFAGTGSQAATFVHNGNIIIGYVAESSFSVFKE